MQQTAETEVIQALDEANRASNFTWVLCRYARQSQVLVLCGHLSSAAEEAYLVFRKPHYVHLSWVVEEARFSIANEVDGEEGKGPHPGPTNPAPYRILIQSQGREFYVDCEGITFYLVADPGDQ